MKTVTVLGLGAMGLPMATNLAKTFNVRGFDVSEERMELAKNAGITVYKSAREAAKETDFLLLAVRDGQQLTAALFEESGVAEVMSAGSTVILTSTIGIDAVEATAERLKPLNLGLVDAPISGGSIRAGKGDLLVTVGAYPDVYERALPVLKEMASTLVWIGKQPGKGQAMKTVNQLLCGVHIAAAGEALALARALELDVPQTLEALMAGAASSFMLGDRGQRMLHAYDDTEVEVRSRLDIFVKDMGIVTAAAKTHGLAVPVAAAAEQEYLLGRSAGLGAHDDSTVIRVVAPK